jgi:Spy/CpxP family protein refolding chaperone
MKFSKVFNVALVLTIIFAGAFAAEAMGPGGHHHGAGLLGLKTLLQLNLTDPQKSQILSIFAKYDIKSVKKNLWEARKNLWTQLQAASDEGSIDGIVSAYLQQVAPLQQQLLSMGAKMVYEIKAVLTPEQLQLLKQHKRATQGAPPTTPNQ